MKYGIFVTLTFYINTKPTYSYVLFSTSHVPMSQIQMFYRYIVSDYLLNTYIGNTNVMKSGKCLLVRMKHSISYINESSASRVKKL